MNNMNNIDPKLTSIVILACLASCLHAFAPLSPLAFSPRTRQCHQYQYQLSCPPNTNDDNGESSPIRMASSSSTTSQRRDSSSSRPKRNSKQKSDKPKRTKLPHDRTIDRRKSPALWRYDLEYSIAPTMTGDTPDDDAPNKNVQPSDDSANNNNSFLPKSPPELMSPAGGWPQLKAAVANGADAVYLGLTSYSARARAANFDPDPTLLHSSKGEAAEEYEPPTEGEHASLAHAVQFAHKHQVRVYVAFNTLVFDEELHEVQNLIEKIWDCGVDAVIIQDVGVAKIVKEVVERLSQSMEENSSIGQDGIVVGKGLGGAPLEIHASTQQTVTCADGVSFAAERTNATRVVVGRELSLSEITQISTNTDTEIEAFVHGALCVSYSGQCFSSEAWGGRSANRGQCAQACRLPYGLIANGELKHLSFDGIEGIMGGKSNNDNEEIQYLLSPQDLCGLEQVEGLTRAGVSCLKIEGRLKDSSYVAATTRAYRQAIDAAWDKLVKEQNIDDSSKQRMLSSPDEHVSRNDLTHVFARGQDENNDGLTPGFFEGPQHQRLVRGRSPRHRGVHVGRVISSNKGAVMLQLDDKLLGQSEPPLKRGDGIVIDRGMPQDHELGGPIYDVRFRDGQAAIRFGRDVEKQWKENDYRSSIPMAPKGSHVWKTADAEIGKRMRKLAELEPPFKSSAKVIVEGRVGEPLTVRIIDERSGKVGLATSQELGVLEEATGSALNTKTISKAIGTLGNSEFILSGLDLSLEDGLWCPMSWVKDTRRRALDSLNQSLGGSSTDNKTPTLSSTDVDEFVVDQLLDEISSNNPNSDTIPTSPQISVLARNFDQVDAICTLIESMDNDEESEGVSEVIVDFLEIEGIRSAVSRIREARDKSSRGLRIVVASPRVIKPGEQGIWRTLLKQNPDAILVRSTGLLHRLTKLGGAGQRITFKSTETGEAVEVVIPDLIGDFSLNAANAITAHELLQAGLSRITAAYDLSANAITELATLLGKKSNQLEVVVHQHMPIFYTEHCVFARFLSNGDSYQDCGHVCTKTTVHLRDQGGKDNLVLADLGCRNTVFMSESQSGLYSMDEWTKANVGHFRIELVDESGKDAVKIVSAYLQFLSNDMEPNDVWDELTSIPDSNGRLMGVGVGSLRNSAERRSGELSSSVH